MTTFAVVYTATASTTVDVEADSAEEARELADAEWEGGPQVCAMCAGVGGGQGIDLGDWEQIEDDYGVYEA
jgi:hypothetical protein